MILAGDIGGTKTLLGLFDPLPARPRPIAVRSFSTPDYGDLASMISAFVAGPDSGGRMIDAACFGVAGPVVGATATLTNVGWRVDARAVERAFDIKRAALLNDLEAMAYAVPLLYGGELYTLQAGEALRGGNMALIAAGTGLGEALLHHLDGRFVPAPSEGGHADFAARTEREIDVLRELTKRFGRAQVEHVLSGPGLLHLYRVVHRERCPAAPDDGEPEAPSQITTSALERRCPSCVETLEMFVDAYGAEAGNLALRTVSTGGMFVGGGIAPKILPALTDGRFIRAFCAKAPFESMLARIPVKVILNDQAGLLGAAVFAAGL